MASWNLESGDSDVLTVAQRIATLDGVDLWGLSEVVNASALTQLEAAAEDGENADFAALLSRSGGADRLAILYNADRFELLSQDELEYINLGGSARAPLLVHLRDRASGQAFVFMVNHLNRDNDQRRHDQAVLLNEWAMVDGRPAIAVGYYNFDWSVPGGENDHDLGYDWLTADDVWTWVRPADLVTTQCSVRAGIPPTLGDAFRCTYTSVLDFVFTANGAQDWPATSTILVADGDFADDETTSDHRPVLAWFQVPVTGTVPVTLTDVPVTPPPPLTATPLPTPTPQQSRANHDANRHAGPGTAFVVVGAVANGQALQIVGRNASGDWYHLADGSWIAQVWVDDAPGALPVLTPQPISPPPIVLSETPTSPPTPTATPSPTPAEPRANGEANLRAGPGANYAIVGGAATGQVLDIVGRNPAGDWYVLADGAWIAAFLVDDAPGSVPITEISPSPPTPTLTATSPPTDIPGPTSTSGSAKVVIEAIFYQGTVPEVESDEYVIIANVGSAPQNLAGWRLYADDDGQDFFFPNFILQPGQACRVYTDEVHLETCGFSFGHDTVIWANGGECGHLYDANGAEVSSYCY